MVKDDKNFITIGVRIETETHSKLKELAKAKSKSGIKHSLSDVIRLAIIGILKQEAESE